VIRDSRSDVNTVPATLTQPLISAVEIIIGLVIVGCVIIILAYVKTRDEGLAL